MQIVQLQRLQKGKESKQEVVADESDSDIIALFGRSISRSRAIGETDDCINALKQINRALTRFKLSKNEAKIYLFLARYGPQKVQQIAQTIGIHRTEAYKTLRSLEAQGLITRILEKPMKFAALPLERVLGGFIDERRRRITQLEQQRKELLEMWRFLPPVGELASDNEMLQVLEGRRCIMAKVSELLDNSEAEFQAVVSDNEMVCLFNNLLFEDMDDKMKKRSLDIRVMTQYSPTSSYIIEKIGDCDMDFAFLRKTSQPSFFISDHKQVLIIMNDKDNKLLAMWTNYGALVASFRNLFEQLWKTQGKPKTT
jgi:sugar-specific transcriptional regulator TrmB